MRYGCSNSLPVINNNEKLDGVGRVCERAITQRSTMSVNTCTVFYLVCNAFHNKQTRLYIINVLLILSPWFHIKALDRIL
jgi:hypothetical protein